jgi:hypothetical protein
MALYTATRAAQAVFVELNARHMLPEMLRWKHMDVVLMCAATAQILYAYVFEPATLPSAYVCLVMMSLLHIVLFRLLRFFLLLFLLFLFLFSCCFVCVVIVVIERVGGEGRFSVLCSPGRSRLHFVCSAICTSSTSMGRRTGAPSTFCPAI